MKCYLVCPVSKEVSVVNINNKCDVSKLLNINGIEYPIIGCYQQHFNLGFLYVDEFKIKQSNKDAWKFLQKESFVRFRVCDQSADSEGEWFSHTSCGKMLIVKYDKDGNYIDVDVDVDYKTISRLYQFSFPE